jgi:hypothetical protein
VAQEYDGIAQDIEKSCGRDLASSYDLAAYIDAWRTRWAVPAFHAAPFYQPGQGLNRHAGHANAEHGRRIDLIARQNSREVEDEPTR